MSSIIRLCDLAPNSKAVIHSFAAENASVKRVKDLGIAQGEEIVCLFRSPFSDPTAYRVNGVTVALRKSDCEIILVKAYE